jgi:hypothetical protein
MRYSDYTTNPHLFAKSYWGSHRETGDEDTPEFREIFTNRDKMVAEFKLKKYNKPRHVYSIIAHPGVKDLLSHLEYYDTTDDMRLVLCSVYPTQKTCETLLADGWREYNRVYSPDLTTFIKSVSEKYPTVRDLRQMCRSIDYRYLKSWTRPRLVEELRNAWYGSEHHPLNHLYGSEHLSGLDPISS